MTRLLSLTLACGLVGCASSGIRDRTISDETPVAAAPAPAATPGAQPKAFNPKSYAAGFPRASECEQAARDLQPKSADSAWAVLRECANRGFNNLKRLSDGGWDADLQSRKDAAAVLAKMIASRGGDIDGDLGMLRKRRIPVFSLSSAMEQPQTYNGRLVITRVKMSELKSEGGRPTMHALETSLGSSQSEVREGTRFVRNDSSSRSGGAYGDGRGSSSTSYETITTRNENAVSETGREALLKLPKADPFLEVNKEFVVLARFEGVRASGAAEGGENANFAVLSVIAYFEPAALLIE